jgi:N-acetylneuraminic acid mutarotase
MIELNEVVVFDPATLTWTQKSPLPYTLSAMDCCVYNDQYIIVVGGGAGPLVGVDSTYPEDMKKKWESDPQYKSYYCPFVLVYDTKTDEWRVLPSLLPMPTSDIHITMIGKKIYALGGENIEPATSNTTPWLRIGQIIE